MSLGLKRGAVQLEPHDKQFEGMFKGVKERWVFNYCVYAKILCITICCYK